MPQIIHAMNVNDLLADMYDIRNMAHLHGFGSLPKDNEGTECTINDCIEHIITNLELCES